MNRTLPSQEEMERAFLARDGSYDGLFFVGVRTTGVFCRPSCPAKRPLRRNIEYHATVRDCLLAGLRPCKRCRPLATNGQAPEWLAAVLKRVEQDPAGRITESDLREMEVEPHRVRRYFQKRFGLTFQGYHRARRMGLALEQLRCGADPLHVAMDTGYDSPSGFRDAFEKVFGTTPGRSNSVVPIKTATIQSPVGPMIAGATDAGVCLLEFADRRALARQIQTLKRRLGGTIIPGDSDHLAQLGAELAEYFAGQRREFSVAMAAPGTAFQEQVWAKLREVPYGTTWSYDQLARAIRRPKAHRAVARANGDNRLAVLIPCHRIVRADGTLCGYGGGLWRKQFLLDLEKASTAHR